VSDGEKQKAFVEIAWVLWLAIGYKAWKEMDNLL